MPLTLSLSPQAGRGDAAETTCIAVAEVSRGRRSSPSPRSPGEGRGEGPSVRRNSVARARGGVADVAALLGNAEFVVADLRERGDAVADLLLCRQREAEAQPRLGIVAIDRPFRPRVERDAGLQCRLHEL